MVGTAHIVPRSNKSSCRVYTRRGVSGKRRGIEHLSPGINEIFLSASAPRVRRYYFEDRLSRRTPGISDVRENSRGSPIMLKARDSHSVGRSVGRELFANETPSCFIEQRLGNYMRTSLGEAQLCRACETFNRCDLAMRFQSCNAEISIIFPFDLFTLCYHGCLQITPFYRIGTRRRYD